jgi:hypothetical protein
LNDSSAKLGAALGTAIARSRAQHQQEKNDLMAVVFCRQNPTGNWTFPNKAPMPCATLEKNVVAYCTVNPKTAICKDVRKLPPPSAVPVPQVQTQVPVQAQSVQQPQPVATQPTPAAVPAAQALTPNSQPIQPPVTQPQSQSQVLPKAQNQMQTQMVNVSTTPVTEEISVAEAARRNKAAKEAAQKAAQNQQAQTPPQQ